MATPPRYFQKGSYYHVYNRGNRKQSVFLARRDYKRFLEKTLKYKSKFGVTIMCYCLIPNHFHFLFKQNTDIPITSFMLRLSTSYAKYFNIKYDQVGSLFQGRFRAKLIETDEYLLHLSRYIHRNPKEVLLYQWRHYPQRIKSCFRASCAWNKTLEDRVESELRRFRGFQRQ